MTSATTRRRWLRIALGCGVAATAAGTVYAVSSSRPEVTSHRRALGFGRRLRVASVSDLHLRTGAGRYDWIVEEAARVRPDIFVVVGDTADHRRAFGLMGFLDRVEAPLGKFATLGNWEYWARVDLEALRRRYAELGTRLLVNEEVVAGGLRLVGLDDWVEGKPDVDLAARAAAGGPALVLSHCPVVFDDAARRLSGDAARRFVMLSGHTHGGQIAPFGIALYQPPGCGPYLKGWFESGGAAMYVQRGVGCSQVQLRLGSRPELLVLDLD
jgi:hypothetical protein